MSRIVKFAKAGGPEGIPSDRERYSGHTAPLSTHSFVTVTNSSKLSEGVARGLAPAFLPGSQAHRTSPVLKCANIWSGRIPPRAGSRSARHNCPALRPAHAIRSGARCQSGAPGTPLAIWFVD